MYKRAIKRVHKAFVRAERNESQYIVSGDRTHTQRTIWKWAKWDDCVRHLRSRPIDWII